MKLQFSARNAKISNNDQLYTDDDFTLSYIKGGPGGARVDPGFEIRNRKKLHTFFK